MNDLFNDPKALIGYLLTVLMGLVMYMWRKTDAETQRRLDYLEKNTVARAYVDQRHVENIGRFDRVEERLEAGIEKIETAVTGTHQRIDQLYRDLLDKN